MASAKVFRMDGSETGAVELNDAVFDVAPNETLVHEAARALLDARRQGNAETKTRKQVRGGGAKPFRQKGTGRARQGSIREPQMRGGGVVFGPHERSYRKKVSLAVKRKALCMALSDRVRAEAFFVMDSLACEQPKTKPFREMASKLPLAGRKTLFVTADPNRNVLLSARNLPRVAVCTVSDMNVVDVLNAGRVVVEQEALSKLEERLT